MCVVCEVCCVHCVCVCMCVCECVCVCERLGECSACRFDLARVDLVRIDLKTLSFFYLFLASFSPLLALLSRAVHDHGEYGIGGLCVCCV